MTNGYIPKGGLWTADTFREIAANHHDGTPENAIADMAYRTVEALAAALLDALKLADELSEAAARGDDRTSAWSDEGTATYHHGLELLAALGGKP